jgi:Ca2+-binding RTX toxin-like protein
MITRRLALLAVAPLASLALVVPPTGAATATCGGQDATILGTDNPDELVGTEGADVVVLGAGNDTFAGKGGDDLICGGAGVDRIYPGSGNDTVYGEGGGDRIYAGIGNDTLDGGGDAYDKLLYTVSGATDLRLDLRNGTVSKSSGDDTITGFAFYFGTPGADTMIGSTGDDYLDGRGGNDLLYGFGGADLLIAFGGSPVIDAGDGDDGVHVHEVTGSSIRLGYGDDNMTFRKIGPDNRWNGGPGSDGMLASGSGFYLNTAAMDVNLNQGYLLVRKTGARQAISAFENVTGSSGRDRIVGNASANRLNGWSGGDTLIGLGGDDALHAGYGSSSYADGGTGNDGCRAEVTVNCER